MFTPKNPINRKLIFPDIFGLVPKNDGTCSVDKKSQNYDLSVKNANSRHTPTANNSSDNDSIVIHWQRPNINEIFAKIHKKLSPEITRPPSMVDAEEGESLPSQQGRYEHYHTHITNSMCCFMCCILLICRIISYIPQVSHHYSSGSSSLVKVMPVSHR